MKSYTDIEQSKKLTEILPLESADMSYHHFVPDLLPEGYCISVDKVEEEMDIPCWSLAVLLNILAKIANKIDDDGSVDLSSFMGQWSVNMFDCPVEASDNYDNPVDACYEMILKLHELKML